MESEKRLTDNRNTELNLDFLADENKLPDEFDSIKIAVNQVSIKPDASGPRLTVDTRNQRF